MKTQHKLTKTIWWLLPLGMIGILLFTPLLSNIWHVVSDREFFIPSESNLLIFKVTKMNPGSGDWWLSAEDFSYYYSKGEDGILYSAFPKSNVQNCPKFQEKWCPEFTIEHKYQEKL
jgi:hypothetical protein